MENTIDQEISIRNHEDKKYIEDRDYALHAIKLHNQLLGLQDNLQILLDINDYKEILSIYRQVILDDNDGHIVEKENQGVVAQSLQNSLSSIGYPSLLKKELNNLVPQNPNSYLVIPQIIFINYHSASTHQIAMVIKKKNNKQFSVFVVDKEAHYDSKNNNQIFCYIVDQNKTDKLANSLVEYNRKPFDIYGKLEDLAGTRPTILPIKPMSQQKENNCYAKQVEAGVKFALWHRNNSPDNRVKWNHRGIPQNQSSTLKLHELYTEALVKRLKLAGYGERVEKKIRANFEKYKSEKKEEDLNNWQRKKATTFEERIATRRFYSLQEILEIQQNRCFINGSELQKILYSYYHTEILKTNEINSHKKNNSSNQIHSLAERNRLAKQKSGLINEENTHNSNQPYHSR